MNLKEMFLKGIGAFLLTAFIAVSPFGAIAGAKTAPVKPPSAVTKQGAIPAQPAQPKVGVKKATPAVPPAKAVTKRVPIKKHVKKSVPIKKPLAKAGKKTL